MKFNVLLVLTVFSVTSFAAKQNTADYWKCENMASGSWTFGEAPKACSASSFISNRFVTEKYQPYIFDEAKSTNNERIRYVSEMNELIDSVSSYYLKKRKPSASLEERAWWSKAIKAISHQESFMSHYRVGTDGELRMMRGDFGHGHGMMQIDDRWHYAAVDKGRAANLVDNLFYALDIYYSGWEKAPKESCVNSSKNYYSRARAAYGIYNGGAASACRFTNPNHKWARNDQNFKDKFDSETWNRYVSASVETTKVDVNCLSNPNQICSTPKNPDLKKVLKYKNLLCALDQNSYKCVEDFSLRFCLVNKFNLINEVVATNINRPYTVLSTEQVCSTESEQPDAELPEIEPSNLLTVGTFVRPEKSIYLRQSPGGVKLNVVGSSESFQILDVKTLGLKNYYQVSKNGIRGYFYTGTLDDLDEWSTKSINADYSPLPVKGDSVRIITPYGTNLRKSPGGEKLSVADNNSILEVISTIFVSETGKFYIQVNVDGTTGFLYTGKTNPYLTTDDWVEVLK
jgi:hypothetical protein